MMAPSRTVGPITWYPRFVKAGKICLQILPVDRELGAEHPRQILVHPSLPSADAILGDCYD
jgi:hypothetical protein